MNKPFDPRAISFQEEWDEVIRVFGGKKGRGWIRTNCPFCLDKTGKDDRKGSIGLNLSTGGYNCFKCGTTGMLPEDMRDEIEYLPPAERGPFVAEKKDPPELPEQFHPLWHGTNVGADWLEPAVSYMRSRGEKRPEGGLLDQVVAEAFIGAAVSGRQANRVIIPLPDYERFDLWDMRSWRGWVSRDYSVWNAKRLGLTPPLVTRPYLYCKNLNRDGYLYNEPALWVETDRPVYVVEGTLDALALWPDAVAVLGKPLESQIAKLVAAHRPVVIALDGDAWEEGWALGMKVRFMRPDRRAGSLKLPPRIDPDEIARPVLDEAAVRSIADAFAVPIV